MHSTTRYIPALVLATLLTGCVGTGPSTQQGAVTGGVLGAAAGALIAGNQHGGDPLGGAILGATLGALAGGTIGNSIDNQNGTLYRTSAPAPHAGHYTTQVQQGPPPTPPAPQTADVVTPAPSSNALWVPGYWDYNGTGYAWAAGHWELPPPNAQTYIAAHWENRSGNYVFVRGYWQ
jgi:hypothetical protein